LPQQILWNKFHIRCAYFSPSCTWSLNYSVLVNITNITEFFRRSAPSWVTVPGAGVHVERWRRRPRRARRASRRIARRIARRPRQARQAPRHIARRIARRAPRCAPRRITLTLLTIDMCTPSELVALRFKLRESYENILDNWGPSAC
jgi:hypothetical protein